MMHLARGDRYPLLAFRPQSDPPRELLSIVVPMRNESGGLEALFERLLPVVGRLGMDIEILCVDDGSTDDTLERLKALRRADPRIKILSLSRNFGKEVALAAGLRHAAGDAVVLMDADLQHPPDAIEAFVAKWREGYRMVYGQRRRQDAVTPVRRFLARGFYRVFATVAQTRLPAGSCDFRLLDRKVVDALNRMTERTRFTKGLYHWVGFKQIGVPFDVAERVNGRTGWSTLGLWRFAIDAITSFSTLPLRVWSYIGGAMSLIALGVGAYWLAREILYGTDTPAFTSVMIAVTLFAGIQLISLGVIGEYLGRVFTEVKRRPLYLVAERHGFDVADDEDDEAAPRPIDEPMYRPIQS